jgi:hypothetical protein
VILKTYASYAAIGFPRVGVSHSGFIPDLSGMR